MSLRWTILAPIYDTMARKAEEEGLGTMREDLLSGADGRVLEIGGGTGANLRYYREPDALVVTEPEPAMLRRLRDTVVSTLVLCGADQERSLGEVRRGLRPGGRLLFLEHVRSDDPAFARFQDRMNWLNRFVVGCECNRQTLSAIEGGGFTISQLEQTEFPKAPKFARPLIVGSAVAG